jgi:beta propeller repeat protein
VQPAIASGIVTWTELASGGDRATVVAYSLETQRRIEVSGPEALPDFPDTDGSTVVWRDRRDGGWAIWAHDLAGQTEFQIARSDSSMGPASISGASVVWAEFHDGSWDIVHVDLATRTRRVLVAGPGDQVDPRISRGRVVYEDWPVDGGSPSLKVVRASGGPPDTIVRDHLVGAPAIDGNLVVWEDWREGVAGIFAYDLERRVEMAIARSEQARQPAVDGMNIAWLNLTAFGGVVAVSGLRPILPSDRRDPPLQADPNVLFFPETGHTLGFGFKTFWQQHGGLPLFGYPLTEEFTEIDPISGAARTVQYFERFLLEYDANEPDAAKRVKIARLGAIWLSGDPPPRLPPVEDTAGRRYFPETGHTLAAGFKEYWDDHDGLMLLGFPISEEMTENGRTVQYFERGRLELDPTNPDPDSRIGPGLLGRDALVARGWLAGASGTGTRPGQGPR